MAVVRQETFGSAGFPFALVRQPAYSCHPRLATRPQLQPRKELHMTTLIPSKIRAIAHRRMALSALRANSSLSVRLKRYNDHMSQARALEAVGGAV